MCNINKRVSKEGGTKPSEVSGPRGVRGAAARGTRAPAAREGACSRVTFSSSSDFGHAWGKFGGNVNLISAAVGSGGQACVPCLPC